MLYFIKRWLNTLSLREFIYQNLSRNLADKLADHNSNYSKYLITLASSAIGLTFVMLQFIDKNIFSSSIIYIKVSWISLGLSILAGLLFNISDILRNFCIANQSRLDSNLNFDKEFKKILEMDDNDIRKESSKFSSLATTFTYYSYLSLIAQTIFFFIAIPSLLGFLV